MSIQGVSTPSLIRIFASRRAVKEVDSEQPRQCDEQEHLVSKEFSKNRVIQACCGFGGRAALHAEMT